MLNKDNRATETPPPIAKTPNKLTELLVVTGPPTLKLSSKKEGPAALSDAILESPTTDILLPNLANVRRESELPNWMESDTDSPPSTRSISSTYIDEPHFVRNLTERDEQSSTVPWIRV